MSAHEDFTRFFNAMPLIAIIRGVEPSHAVEIGETLVEAGIRIIEVPLNSPEPFKSIGLLAKRFGSEGLVGGGTVLTPEDAGRVCEAGGRIAVSPNMNPKVIEATLFAGMVSCPGIFTPSEAFAALDAGAHLLKLFPAEAASPKVAKALRAVLPRDIPLAIVGGVGPDSIGPWIDAGANGFGLGSGLYKPGQSAGDTAGKARAYVNAVREARG